MSDYNTRITEDIALINNAITEIICEEYSACSANKVIEAEEYSLNAGGKRIRPLLCLEFYKLFGGERDVSKLAACLELVHTFSLIHDDMPEMDNDELRRGKPTTHIAYGSATALLAGDGLAILPYKVISDSALEGDISFETATKLTNLLACSSGNEGMIAGQMIDIDGETRDLSRDEIVEMYRRKTGALIKCACLFGAVLAGANDEQLKNTETYAENIGVVFQLVDDILNIKSTAEELGKPVGTDKYRNKSTLISHIGEDAVLMMISQSTDKAINAIESYEDAEFLIQFAEEMSKRKN